MPTGEFISRARDSVVTRDHFVVETDRHEGRRAPRSTAAHPLHQRCAVRSYYLGGGKQNIAKSKAIMMAKNTVITPARAAPMPAPFRPRPGGLPGACCCSRHSGRSADGLEGSVILPNIARNKSPGTSGSRRSDGFAPRLHRRCPEGSVRSCRGEMALDVEGILDGGMR